MNYAICPHCQGLQPVENGAIKLHSLPVDYMSASSIEEFEELIETPPPNCSGSGQTPQHAYPLGFILSNGLMRKVNPKTFTLNSSGELVEKL